MRRIATPIGEKFNHLTILSESGLVNYPSGHKRLVKCKCDCGNETVCTMASLKSNHTKSCGCINVENRYADIKNKNPNYRSIYRRWYNMLARCLDKDNWAYNRYGGRGIMVCEEWKNNFKSFYSWAIESGFEYHLQLDRKNNDNGYCPENCRWVTGSENVRNSTSVTIITHNGVSKSLVQWSEDTGISYYVLRARISRGWPISDVFSPVGAIGNKAYQNKMKLKNINL